MNELVDVSGVKTRSWVRERVSGHGVTTDVGLVEWITWNASSSRSKRR